MIDFYVHASEGRDILALASGARVEQTPALQGRVASRRGWRDHVVAIVAYLADSAVAGGAIGEGVATLDAGALRGVVLVHLAAGAVEHADASCNLEVWIGQDHAGCPAGHRAVVANELAD